MSTDFDQTDILEQYRTISNKLKKRFLRKPNVAEACDSFTQLGQQCEFLDVPAYAGLCWISTARCEGSLSNLTGETSSLIRAGRQFMKAEKVDRDLGCSSPAGENFQAASGCYGYASSRYMPNSPLAIGLNLELVSYLRDYDNDNDNREHYLHNAIHSCGDDNVETRIYCLNLVARHYIESRHFLSALNVFTEIVQLCNDSHTEILRTCEINRVFLLLILRPAPQKLAPSLAKLLEKYTWGDKNDEAIKACRMREVMFLLLQSLVAICQSVDTMKLAHLEGELWDLLEAPERDLLRILVKVYL